MGNLTLSPNREEIRNPGEFSITSSTTPAQSLVQTGPAMISRNNQITRAPVFAPNSFFTDKTASATFGTSHMIDPTTRLPINTAQQTVRLLPVSYGMPTPAAYEPRAPGSTSYGSPWLNRDQTNMDAIVGKYQK